MLIASIGAFVLGEFIEAVAIILFFQIGELFQGYAVEKSRNTIINTMNLKVNVCHLENGDDIEPEDCNVGDVILVRPGEMIPIDGISLSEGSINCASLTGEAHDIDISVNDTVLSGSINVTNPIKVKTTKNYYDSTASKILDMIENAKSGHPGIALGAAPILYALYSKHINVVPSDDKNILRDRFIMSAGHGSSIYYATLHAFGYDITM